MAKAPLYISAGHLKAIGNLVVYWSWLEVSIQIALWRLMGVTEERGMMLTAHTGLISIIGTLKMLSADRYGEKSKRHIALSLILDRVEPLRIERNAVVHGLWRYTKRPRRSQPAQALKISAKGKLKLETTGRTENDITDVTDDIWVLTSDLRDFVQKNYPKKRLSSPSKGHEIVEVPKRERRIGPPRPNPDKPPRQPRSFRA